MIRIGMDVGGTGIQIGIVDEEGRILEKGSSPTRINLPFSEQIAQMAACALDTLRRSGHSLEEVISVGAGVPGIADQQTGVVLFCTNMNWHNVPFREEMRKHIDKPILIDNDATVAGLAESVAGISAGTSSSVFLTLGTGVGGGIVIGGQGFSGSHGVASEIGHMVTVDGGEMCTCGNRGCWERYASATALIREGRKLCAARSAGPKMRSRKKNRNWRICGLCALNRSIIRITRRWQCWMNRSMMYIMNWHISMKSGKNYRNSLRYNEYSG